MQIAKTSKFSLQELFYYLYIYVIFLNSYYNFKLKSTFNLIQLDADACNLNFHTEEIIYI